MEKISDLSNEDYHAHEAISQSSLKKILRSLAHFKHSKMKETPALRMGRIIHDALLTPAEFKKKYCVGYQGDKRTKQGKVDYAAWKEEMKGKEELKEDEYQTIISMIESINLHPAAPQVLSYGEKEVSFFVEFDEFPGIKLKCRPDILDGPAIFDLKTTKDASEREFSKAIVNFGYDFQAAFYMDVVNRYYEVMGINERVKDFIFWPIEKENPHGMAFYIADKDVILRGRSSYMKCLQDLAMQLERVKANPDAAWPGYSSQFNPIYLPSWA